jgi:hypothetical protein
MEQALSQVRQSLFVVKNCNAGAVSFIISEGEDRVKLPAPGSVQANGVGIRYKPAKPGATPLRFAKGMQMKALVLSVSLISGLASLSSSVASADPRPPGGHRITSQPIPAGTCRKQLTYFNKFSSAYVTVCNKPGRLF